MIIPLLFNWYNIFCLKCYIDVPQPPEGPLNPNDITKSSCVLRWNPPKDDGGSEITHYIVEKMDADTSRWVPVGDAAGTSMRYNNHLNIKCGNNIQLKRLYAVLLFLESTI